MKVAVVCPYDLGVPGGVQDQSTRLVIWLEKAGHKGVLIGPGTTGPPGAVLLGPATSVRANRSVAPVILNPRVGRRLRDAIGDADVVHVHEPLVPLVGPGALRAARGVKVVTFHADPSRAVRGAYKLAAPIGKRLLRRARVATAVSPVAATGAAPLARCRIVPNGIDVADYAAGEKTPGRVLFVGRDDPRKGLDVLLEAWPAVRASVPHATLHVVGAVRPEAAAGVLWRGRVDEAEKRVELAAAEVLAAPNLGGESFGIVVLEGMASRCAVVASALPAFVAVLGGAGTLVAAGDAWGLGRAIEGLLGDQDRRAEQADAGAAHAAGFDGAVVAGAYVEAYREALAS